jgi:hypothetical protein
MNVMSLIADEDKRKKEDKGKKAPPKDDEFDDESTFDGVVRELEKDLFKDPLAGPSKRKKKK